MASTTTSGPRYAPEDPTLPKPWRGLIDGNTGYLYFWNPETNVTQYERPSALPPPLLPPGNPPPTSIKLASVSLSSSIHVQHSDDMNRDSSDHGQHYASGHSTGPTVNDSYSHQQYNSRNDGGQGSQPKLASIPSSRSQQVTRDIGGHTQNHAISHGNGASGTHVHGSNTLSSSSSQIDRSLGRTHAPGSGTGLSADAYRRQHEITIMGDNVPAPFTTFDCSDFPPEILKQ